jgi:DUF4097 and DUF4098 domain-containing protein YvlB
MPSFDTPEPIGATVQLRSGLVRIIASDRTDTVVDVRPSDEFDDGDGKAAEQTQVEYSQGRLLVKGPKHRSRWLTGWGPSIVMTIELPSGSSIDVSAAAADVRCEGRLGETKIDNAYGEIWLERAARLRLRTGYGGITVARSDGDADIATSGGEVRIGEIDGSAVIKNAHGDITVDGVTGHLRLSTASGDITVGRTLADVAAKTAYGGVRIGRVVRGVVVAETSYGRLEVGVAAGTAAWLDVSSQYGRVDASLEASDGPAESDETAEVRARTAYGDVVIHRA